MSPYTDQSEARTMKSTIEGAIVRQHLLMSTINAVLQLANKAERTWTRRSKSCIRLRQRCIDFACQFQSLLGLTIANLIRDYVRIRDLKSLLLQLRDEGAKTVLVLHGKLKQVNDELKRGSRASLVEQSAGLSAQPTDAHLACHIRDAQILLGTIRGTNLDSSNHPTDKDALLEAAASLADSIDPYLPGCAVLLRGSRPELLNATLESLLTSMQTLLGDSKNTPKPYVSSPNRIFSRKTSLPLQLKPLPDLAESMEKKAGTDDDVDRESLRTLVVHNIDEVKWTRP